MMPAGLLVEISPWVQGLFGGAGATLFWELVVKPSRERRSVARVLAEEIVHNLEIAKRTLASHAHDPRAIPADFGLSVLVFNAIAPTIGALPELTSGIVLLYRKTQMLNALPDTFADSLREYRAETDPLTRSVVEGEMRSLLVGFSAGLSGFISDAQVLLPKLRKAALPFYRRPFRLPPEALPSDAEIEATAARSMAARRQAMFGKQDP